MKRVAEPGALVLYKGTLAEVIGIADGRTIILETIGIDACGRCGQRERFHLLENSRAFQDDVEPVPTVTDTMALGQARSLIERAVLEGRNVMPEADDDEAHAIEAFAIQLEKLLR